MPPRSSFLEFVLEQLAHLGADVRPRAMFGGWGLYLDDRFFAVIAYDRLYLKTSDDTVAPFTAAGMEPFTEDGKVILPRYYEVPLEVLEDHLELGRWSQTAASLSEPKAARKPRNKAASKTKAATKKKTRTAKSTAAKAEKKPKRKVTPGARAGKASPPAKKASPKKAATRTAASAVPKKAAATSKKPAAKKGS